MRVFEQKKLLDPKLDIMGVQSLLLVLLASWESFVYCSSRILKEKQIPRKDFIQSERSIATADHVVVIAIRKQNMDKLEQSVLERATPGSPSYQQWMSYDEVTSLVQNEESHDRVKQWLESNNVNIKWTSRRKDYIRASTTIQHWEELLQTQFYTYIDHSLPSTKSQRKRTFQRSTEYSIPTELKDDIHAIFNTVQTPPLYRSRYYVKEFENGKQPFRTNLRISPSQQEMKQVNGDATSSSNLTYVTVSFLNSYYGVPSNIGSSSLSQSVFETSDEYYSTNDLTQFQQSYCVTVQGAQQIGDHALATCVESTTEDCNEGNLDIQYIMGMAQKTTSIFWWVTEDGEDPFLSWITAVADESNPPQVNSISWGTDETSESGATMNSFNNEAIILASMGVTIFASSGDNGVADVNGLGVCQCNANTGFDGGQGYFPSFPATSPYVTAAGATQGPELGDPEIACQSQEGGVITTGGGFSTYFSRPSWQSEPVSNYLSRLSGSEVPANGYNTQGRGYPDISLIGVYYQVIVGGTVQTLFGTSATAPVLAAFTSLVNAQRLELGMSSVGWINPTLYAVGWNNTKSGTTKVNNIYNASFNDVTSGNNKCCADSLPALATCCNSGFYSTEGWDPVTGWGSVNFMQYAKMFGVDNVTALGADAGCSSGGSTTSSLSSGAIAGIVVGTLAGLGLIITIAYCVCFGMFNANRSPDAYGESTMSVTANPVLAAKQ